MSKSDPSYRSGSGDCTGGELCPLSCVKAGQVVCIRELATSAENQARLRELGFGEQQHVKLLNQNSTIICQVCNARLGISRKLAEAILVEPLPLRSAAAA